MEAKTEAVLKVDGMTCEACVRHVGGALRTLDGVSEVQVDLKRGEARVTHDPQQTTLDELIEALRDAGYGSRDAA